MSRRGFATECLRDSILVRMNLFQNINQQTITAPKQGQKHAPIGSLCLSRANMHSTLIIVCYLLCSFIRISFYDSISAAKSHPYFIFMALLPF